MEWSMWAQLLPSAPRGLPFLPVSSLCPDPAASQGSGAICRSVAQSCPTLCDPMDCSTQAFLCFTISWNLLKLMSIESMMPPHHLILCHPLLLLPSIFPSIRVSSRESALHTRWAKYWSFSFSICPSK